MAKANKESCFATESSKDLDNEIITKFTDKSVTPNIFKW